MFALHVKKGLSAGRTIADMMDYVRNPEKTRNGELVTGYECSQRVAEMEFVLAHERYSQNTGRGTDGQNVLGYHIRQAFKPGEIDPETANRLGYELAMRFTRGHHSFIVATHIDRHHIHNHIIFNSVDNSCNKKFRDWILSNQERQSGAFPTDYALRTGCQSLKIPNRPEGITVNGWAANGNRHCATNFKRPLTRFSRKSWTASRGLRG